MADKKISALTAATTPLAGTEVLPIVQSGATVKVSVDNLTAGKAVNASSLQLGDIGAADATYQGRLKLEDGATSLQQVGGVEFVTSSYAAGYGWKISSIDSSGVQLAFGTRQNSANWTEIIRLTSDNNLKISNAGKGIDFSANSNAPGMTSELLTWYEEGTWTPTLQGGSTAGSYTVSTTSAKYTRIGRQVTVTAGMVITVNSAGTGVAKFGGLPFAKGADQFLSGSVYTSSVSYGAGVLSVNVQAWTSGSSSDFALVGVKSGTAPYDVAITDFVNGSAVYVTMTYFV